MDKRLGSKGTASHIIERYILPDSSEKINLNLKVKSERNDNVKPQLAKK
jgi:hypothetical protein